MHEMSLAEGIVELVEETAKRENALKVRRVVLEIGCLSSIEPDALRFCFDAVTCAGVADGAILDILPVPGLAWCPQCAASQPMQALYDCCPVCGDYRMQPTAGMEMRVKEIEIE
ncbi:hydrogenase maturation nickel metallochaperone HypA [Azonexus sp.]|uniref:hydrogenase maturation nickel metallochaperone HypA n=1 Tax=Azonexus sp. TaxID=1872668 RepID=UPI0027BAD3E7|nr:hydrogenase maturation nickel metallochaperone HypA [Azonexus sp.]